MRLKKRKKSGRFRGSRLHGRAAKKAHGKGHHGGKGMSGTGKRAGQKKTFVDKYFHPYFGKSGETSKSTEKNKLVEINIRDIIRNLEGYVKKGIAKKTSAGYEIVLKEYKILAEGDIKEKIIITARKFSASAQEKIEKAGGKCLLAKPKKEE